METSLHRDLKHRYTPAHAPRTEAVLGRFRIDAIRADGELVEIQHSALGQMRDKAATLLQTHRLRIVKPIVTRKRLQLRSAPDGDIVRERLSPSRGRLQDIFDELAFSIRIFPHDRLTIELLPVEMLEIRVPGRGKRRRRRAPERDVTTHDQLLLSVGEPHCLRTPADLLALLGRVPTAFTSGDIVAATGIRARTATRAVWCLRTIGAVRDAGKRGRFRLVEPIQPDEAPPFRIRPAALVG
ncbi:MAG: hypothetical protein AB7K09_20690 [Planctomycetota bacterium]